ncbi:MAG: hypothetical protein HY042_08260 [Spirochaetia bacterium]|nr:hypothetical protein [Spirochaetia bacterium]
MSGSSESKKPHNASPIVITGGDPAGVGPELILQLCPRMLASGVPVTYFFTGSSQSLESFVAKTEDTVPELRVRVAREASASTAPQPGTLNVIPVSRAALGGKEPPEPGRPGPDGGRSAFEALRMACEYVRAEAGSLLTASL